MLYYSRMLEALERVLRKTFLSSLFFERLLFIFPPFSPLPPLDLSSPHVMTTSQHHHSEPASFFPSYSLDQAFSGFTAGIVSTLCMQPLDLLKVQLQVQTTSNRSHNALGQIWVGLREITRNGGLGRKGLYRGIGPNLTGNATSWGLYFLWYVSLRSFSDVCQADCEGRKCKRYTDFKKRLANSQDENVKLNAGQHLLASASSGTLVLTHSSTRRRTDER